MLRAARRLPGARPPWPAAAARSSAAAAAQPQRRRLAASAGRGRRRPGRAPEPPAGRGDEHWLRAGALEQLPPSLRRLPLGAEELARVLGAGRREGPAAALQALVDAGAIEPDAGQRACCAALQGLWESLRHHALAVRRWEQDRAAWAERHAEWERCHAAWRRTAQECKDRDEGAPAQPEADEPEEPAEPPRPSLASFGRYVWGGVGGGKSLLMDLFVECCRADSGTGRPVHRVHFHEFMHGVHRNLHELREAGAERTTRAVARGIAKEARLLAFDEFQITNISDALIVETLMDGLFAEDVAVVMTSNRQPEELYKDGLNRHLAIPQLLSLFGRRGVSFHELAAARDFRVAPLPRGAGERGAADGAGPWRDFFCKRTGDGPCEAGAQLRAAFAEAAGASEGRPATVPIAWGRTLDVSEVACGVGLFSFGDLCGRALNADDYLSLARQLHTVVVADVPCFTLDQHDEARRFTNLIDCLYESHARLVVSADGPPKQILSAMEVLAGVSLAGADEGPPGRGSRGPPPPAGAAAPFGSSDWVRHNPFSPEPAPISEAIRRAARGPNDAAVGNDDTNTGTAGVAGVMAGAVGSLQESGFAARRATSRLLHMQSGEYLQAHRAARLSE